MVVATRGSCQCRPDHGKDEVKNTDMSNEMKTEVVDIIAGAAWNGDRALKSSDTLSRKLSRHRILK